MTTLTLHSAATCSLCGCRIRGFRIGTFRVNKASLVSPGGTLVYREPRCPECGWETTSAPEVWRADPESQAKIDAARAKRGWA